MNLSLKNVCSLSLVATCLWGIGTPKAVWAQDPPERTLVLENIEVEGNTRTRDGVVLEHVDLLTGEPLDPVLLLDAAAALRRTRIFRDVTVHTRPGSKPGSVVAVFQVEERRPHLRLGAGYEDVSGWYLIPVQLNMDNLTGHGEALSLSSRLGYRVSGLVLDFRSKPEYLDTFTWGARIRAEAQDRIYFVDETELNQGVARGGLDLGFGVPLSGKVSLNASLSFEAVEPDSHATVYQDRAILGRNRGDRVSFADLPPGIGENLERREQTRLALSLRGDGRRGTGLAMHGLRGHIRLEGVTAKEANFLSLTTDIRGYSPLGSHLLLAGRMRAGIVSNDAPFYERFYLGGLYSVRGFPSHSLSPPQGNTRLWTASGELRSAWIGPRHNPRVTGLLFIDVGLAGDEETLHPDDVAVGIGYGFRVRVPWVQQIGLDIGVPLTESVLDEAFHLNLSLGWTY